MVSNKLMAVAFAALASLAVVDAGVCIPPGTTTISATETSSTATATSTSVTIGTGSTTTSGSVSSAETSSTTAQTSSGTTSASSAETTSTAAETSSTLTTLTTIETSSAQTTSTTVETSSGTTSAQTTSTTAEVAPTNLVTNPEFDQGLEPWQAIPYPDQYLYLTQNAYNSGWASRLLFKSKSGSPFTNYLYHRIDKSLIAAGSYALEAFVKVDKVRAGEGEDGCTRAVAACLAGPIGETRAIPGVAVLAASDAAGQWARISTTCDVTEETLDEFEDFGVAVGFECINVGVNLDAVSFKLIE